MRGPHAKPKTKTVTANEPNSSLAESNSFTTSGTAGENMDEASGVMKVMLETIPTKRTFFHDGKFCGFSISSGPSHVTRLVSTVGGG